MHQNKQLRLTSPLDGTRGGRLKAPPIMVYPSSELERELIVLAARLTGGRRPSSSAFLIDAALARIQALPNKTQAIQAKLAQIQQSQIQPENGDGGPHPIEPRQGTIDRIAASAAPLPRLLTISEAKEGLAHSFGITAAEVQITIRA